MQQKTTTGDKESLDGMPGLAGLLTRLWRRMLAGGLEDRSRTPRLRVLETLAVGGRRQVALISCGEERFLVGMGADAVNTIVRVGGESSLLWQEGAA